MRSFFKPVCLPPSWQLRLGWYSSPTTCYSSFFSRFFLSFHVPSSRGRHLIACLGSMLTGMRNTCQYRFHRRVFTTLTNDCWTVLLLSSISLMWSYHTIFRIFLNHKLSNLLIRFSISFDPFSDSLHIIESRSLCYWIAGASLQAICYVHPTPC